MAATPDRCGSTSPTRSTTSSSTATRIRQQRLPGAPPHYLRAELLYKHPSGYYFGPNIEWVPQAYFVDSANTLTTEPYAHLGPAGGLRQAGTVDRLRGRPQSADKAYIASASIIDRATPALPLFDPGTGRAVYAGMKSLEQALTH